MPSPVVSCATSELRCSALSRIPASDAGSLQVRLRLLLCPFGSNIVVRTACCSVGVVLPVYSTFKAIETKDQDDQHKWLVCWAAYGSFIVAEIFTDKLLYWADLK
ncbi:HVA22-like protein k isoform X2 [Salvia miltiorrhiza]|uniref:HVA22-like protein k isoform X2 n=1 Tax=Salvia miltiorrhiza TaxID=226208 RepID=UPI0025AC376A|nr:HVA22-like protein k isoform X2 [Salvia miltiorrhiza]